METKTDNTSQVLPLQTLQLLMSKCILTLNIIIKALIVTDRLLGLRAASSIGQIIWTPM